MKNQKEIKLAQKIRVEQRQITGVVVGNVRTRDVENRGLEPLPDYDEELHIDEERETDL